MSGHDGRRQANGPFSAATGPWGREMLTEL